MAEEPQVEIRAVSSGDWQLMRDVRLAALAEAPDAFGSTYAREAGFSEQQWQARISDRAVTYLAYLPGQATPAGLAGVYLDEDATAQLVSMWVAPAARGKQVGRALVEAAAAWARARGHRTLFLWVTEANAPARRLYEGCGFTPTGESQPLPSNPDIPEIRMRRPL